jgi:hypothetical protein
LNPLAVSLHVQARRRGTIRMMFTVALANVAAVAHAAKLAAEQAVRAEGLASGARPHLHVSLSTPLPFSLLQARDAQEKHIAAIELAASHGLALPPPSTERTSGGSSSAWDHASTARGGTMAAGSVSQGGGGHAGTVAVAPHIEVLGADGMPAPTAGEPSGVVAG